jgi:hypothetical protein
VRLEKKLSDEVRTVPIVLGTKEIGSAFCI